MYYPIAPDSYRDGFTPSVVYCLLDNMQFLQTLGKIRAFIFDVDGVMTDGGVIMMPSGEAVRRMNIKDGYALQLAKRQGSHVAVISGGSSEAIRSRFHGLGIYDVYLNASDKLDVLKEFCMTHSLEIKDCLFMGDDIPDYEVMKAVGLPCCPADAAEEIKEISMYVSPIPGGAGCVRDVLEKAMKIQRKWPVNTGKLELEDQFRW